MGEPRHTNNVRRVDFAKGNSRLARARAAEAEEKHLPRAMLEPRSGEPDRLKVVPLPERRGAPQRGGLTAPKQNALLVVIILLAAMLGAVLAALLLNPTL